MNKSERERTIKRIELYDKFIDYWEDKKAKLIELKEADFELFEERRVHMFLNGADCLLISINNRLKDLEEKRDELMNILEEKFPYWSMWK